MLMKPITFTNGKSTIRFEPFNTINHPGVTAVQLVEHELRSPEEKVVVRWFVTEGCLRSFKLILCIRLDKHMIELYNP